MASTNRKPKIIDEYLRNIKTDQRAALEKLRKTIRSAAPKAQECISYRLPAFRPDGRSLVAFGAWANHCSFYPMSSATLKDFQDDLKDFQTRHDSLFTGQTLAGDVGEEAGQSADGRGQGLIRCDREQMLHLGK